MKLKKLSGLLSAVLAGAMVLSMAPAAFAAATDLEKPGTCYTPMDSTHHLVQTLYENGEYYESKADCVFQDGNPCVCGNTKPAATDTSWCNHAKNHWMYEDLHNGTHNVVCTDCGETVSQAVPCVYTDGKCVCGATKPEEVGTTYTVIDATHHHVHAVYEDGTVYDADVPCVFETGTCVCGNTCPHSTFKYENNGNGTHKVICAECGAVVTEATECVYGEDGKGTCACGAKYACDHMGNHWTYVNNGNSTHNVVCTDCGAVVSANVACNYKNGVCITCGAKQSECNHMGNHWKYVKNGNGTHNVVCADCGAVVSANVACNYENGVCITCGAKQPAAPKPGHGTIDPNFGVGYHPICEFFRAVFRFLFGRH